jgi:hypothetical protein
VETKYIVRTPNGYYLGNGFTKLPLEAMLFDTQHEAQKRCKLRGDWHVEDILVPTKPPAYAFEQLRTIALAVLFCLLFVAGAKAQVVAESSTIASVTNSSGAQIATWVNDGETLNAPPFTQTIASGSLRGNGVADIVVIQAEQICVLLSNGNGTLQAPACFGSFTGLIGVAVADIDQDGHLDIAAVSQGAVNIYFGDGTGVFPAARTKAYTGLTASGTTTPHTSPAIPGFLSGPFIGSFNGDGKPGIALSSNCNTNNVATEGGTFLEIISDAGSTGTVSVFDGKNLGSSCGQIEGTANLLQGSADVDLIVEGIGFFDLNDGIIPGPSGYNVCNTPPVPEGIILGCTSATTLSQIPITIQGQQQTAALGLSPILSINGQPVTTDVVNPVAMIVDTFTTSGLQDVAILHQNGLSIFLQGSVSASFSQSTVSLTSAQNNATSTQVTFTNTGTAPINPLALVVSGNGDWSQTSNCPTSLAAGTFCTVTLTFDPASVESTSNATLSASGQYLTTQSVTLNGTEQQFVSPVLSQNAINFNSQIVNTTSATQIVSLTNNGNEAFVPTITVTGPFALALSGNCLSVVFSNPCSLSFSFTPTAPGPVTGTATVSFSTGNPSQQIALSGTGVTVPTITTQPANESVVLGSPVTFMIASSGTSPLSYAWSLNGSATGTNSSTLTFTPVAANQGAQIVCMVSNAYGSATSQTASLTINFVPAITTPLANQSVTLGQTATFTTVATGSAPLSYSWTKAGVSVGTNSPTYTTAPTTSADNGASIAVKVTNAYGSASSSATLAINFPPAIQTQPTSQTITYGSPVTFAVVATGTGTLSYAWSKNGVAISGATAASYTYTPSVADNQASFTVLVTSTYGSTTSSAAILTVLTVPTISTQPANTSAVLGQSATFSVVAAGSAPLLYSWTQAGVTVGSNSPTFTTAPTTSASNGNVINVTVKNAAGQITSANATLTVDFPVTLTQQPASVTVLAGATASFSVTATGTNLSYQWQRNGANIAGATSASYSFATADADNGALFDCVVSNAYGPSATSNQVLLTVNIPAGISNQSPGPYSAILVVNGQTASMSVTAYGTAPLTYQWQVNGVNVAGATGTSYTTPALTAVNSNLYTVVVTNAYGSVTSVPWTTAVIEPPAITNQSSNAQTLGQTYTMSATVTTNAGPTATIVWTLNGTVIPNATSPIYTTGLLTTTSSGVYQMTATDAAGSSSVSWTISIAGQIPSFTVVLGPTTQTVQAGATASLNATVDAKNFVSTSSPIQLTCTTTVPGGVCTLKQTSVPSYVSSQVVGATVTVPSTASLPVVPSMPIWPWLGTLLAAFVVWKTRPSFRRRLVPLAASCAVLLALGGCMGGQASTKIAPPTPPTTPTSQTYTVTVTATTPGVPAASSTANIVVEGQ